MCSRHIPGMDGWVGGWMVGGWVDGWWVGGWMVDGWMDGWWMDGWMDGWMRLAEGRDPISVVSLPFSSLFCFGRWN